MSQFLAFVFFVGLFGSHTVTVDAATSIQRTADRDVIDQQSGAPLDMRRMMDAITRVPVVLIGEIHDNAAHHLRQAAIIDALVANGRKPVIVFEMFRASEASLIEAWNAGAPDARDQIGTWWEASGWPAFALYEPIFTIAARHGLKIAHSEARGDAAARKQTGDDLLSRAPLTDAQTTALLAGLKTSHCDLLPEAMLPRMARAQRRRDALLAASVAQRLDSGDGEENGDGGVVVIAGSGHTRADRGIPHYLRALGIASVSIQLTEEGSSSVLEGRGERPDVGRFIWTTPAPERDDPCVELRKMFGGGAKAE